MANLITAKFPYLNYSLHVKHNYLLMSVVLFICAVGNASYIQQVLAVYTTESYGGFLVALAAVSVLFTALVAAILSLVMPLKVALIALLLITASASYYVDTFGVVIDDVMIQNLFETNVGEAFDLLSASMFIRILIFGIVPSFLLLTVQLPKLSVAGWLKVKAQLLVSIIALLCVLLVTFSSHFTVFFREHKTLRYYLNPVYPIYSFVYNIKNKIKTPEHIELQRFAIKAASKPTGEKAKLLVVVVGETVRASNIQLNGYKKETTPNLAARDNLVYFSNVSSCGTSTAISVPCMFSFYDQSDFSADDAKRQENALDVLSKSGINVLWRDNNSSSKGVADRVSYEDFKTAETNPVCDVECRDIGMLAGLEDYLAANTGDTIIVLHQMGNHGPAYYKRYPESFEKFSPACKTKELSQCTPTEIENAYDNAVAYTDYFLNETIEFLTRHSDNYDTAMLYVSDHGESLGENGIYLHGMPYMLAPTTQTHVPMLVWSAKDNFLNITELHKLKDHALSHDAIAYSLIDFFDVELQEKRFTQPRLLAKQPLSQEAAFVKYAMSRN